MRELDCTLPLNVTKVLDRLVPHVLGTGEVDFDEEFHLLARFVI